jgi:predicted acylesterase/phospholipase RssA
VKLSRIALAVAAGAVLAALIPSEGCASTSRRNAVPFDLHTQAYVTGFPREIRYFPRDAEQVQDFVRDYLASLEREKAWLASQGRTGPLPPSSFLAISGGGDNGAFGAGLLKGWSEAGTRPEFKLVTGVSTGALIAPFAFLGPDWDDRLKAIYTGISMHDVAKPRWFVSAFFEDAMSDNTPLWDLIRKSITREMLDAIAAEYEKGRLLFVATANLDVRRAVIWNIGKIATSRSPEALELVHKILIASAAIPGTFPPVMIDVEAGGKSYQEMHVDGGTVAQVFIYPAAVRLHDLVPRDRTLYIIRNARLDPEWAEVERRTLPIALRAIGSLIQYQGIGDLYRIYTITQRDEVAYNLAYIPKSFETPHTSDFDTSYMRALYYLGYAMAVKGYPWEHRPPVLVSGVDEEASKPSP